MEDYEHANAREWDLNQSDGRTRQPPDDSWKVVGGSKKQPKVRIPRPPPQLSAPYPGQPLTQPPTIKNQQNGHVDRRKQSSAGGTHHSQPPQPAPQASKRAFENSAPQQNLPHSRPSRANQKFGDQQSQRKSDARSPPFPSKQTQDNQVQQPRQQRASPEWTQQEGRLRDTRQRRLPPVMTVGSENLGERLWRERGPAQAHVRIPIELASQDKGHIVIAKQHQTFILHQGKSGGSTSTEFGIWGDPAAVDATVEDIRAWIEDWQSPRKSNKCSKFAKVVSLTPALQYRAERQWQNEVKKHRFRQFPPPDKGFEAIGSFHWPMNEYKPEEILGSSYEALDPIRMDCKCYVVFDKEQGLFRVMGKSDAVRTGLVRLRGTYLQIATRQATPLQLYLLHEAYGERAGKNIILKDYDRIRMISGEDSEEPKTGYSPRVEDGELDFSTANEGVVCRLVMSKLNKLHYYRGSIQMRMRLGTFLATRYLRSESGHYTIDEYKAMIRESAFHGEVTQELGDKVIEKAALGTLQAANDFFTPADPMTEHLSDVRPLYTAVFTFNDPSNSEAGNIRLAITWKETTDANSTTPTYEQISKKWMRLDRDSEVTSPILDISLSELRTGMAWKFEIHAAQSIEESRLPNGFFEFGDMVKPETNASRNATKPSATDVSFVVYRSSFAHLKHLEQRLIYCYQVVGTDYTVELSRFQHRSFPAREARILAKAVKPAVFESRWGLSVHRIEWDTMFAKNERLPIGEKADLSHEEEVWFPSEYSPDGEKLPGFAQMMEKLKRIKTLVMDADGDDLIGGMKIG